MQNFVSYTPTRVVFGRDTELETGKYIKMYGGTNVLIVYGGGSAVKSGLIAKVESALIAQGITFREFGGAKPNPTVAHAEAGVKKALEMKADFILAVGGGSAIDTAKAIAHGTANFAKKLWELWTNPASVVKSLPVGAILTIPAAGSEMSDSAVLTNEELGIKLGLSTELNRCRFAILDPALAASLPKYQLAAGVTDIMMHTMERYFIPGSCAELTDEIAEGLLRTVIANGRKILADPADFDAMGEIYWCSSVSHNGTTGLGRARDFSVHALGQALGAVYDYTHGATLSAVWQAWAEYLYKDCPERFARYARKVWGVEEPDDLAAAEEGIRRTVAFFREIGMPVTIAELGAEPDDETIHRLASHATKKDTVKLTQIRPLGIPEVEAIFRNAR